MRIYNLSRGTLILSILIYPILSFLLISFVELNTLKRMVNKPIVQFIPLGVVVILITTLFVTRNNNDLNYSIESVTTTNPIVFGIVESECNEWLGSDNFSECIDGVKVDKIKAYDGMLTNVIVFEDKIFVLDKSGIIYDLNKDEIFLDIRNKVMIFDEFAESGLFSLAFNPNKNFLLVSYSDAFNNLIVEEYELNSKFSVIQTSSKIVKKIPNTQCCHYSGNIIWSNYFNDFLLGVGDMQNKEGFLHSDPLDTTSPRGKILFINNAISDPDLLAVDSNYEVRRDILAFGLRNPWKTVEYKNYLFVPDIGKAREEELNIVDLSNFTLDKKPYLFGWPHYEGTRYNSIKFNQILLHTNNSSSNINDYVSKNTLIPEVYYSHNAPENYRAAIIGGGVIEFPTSKYFEHYFFADYLSNELFAYDFNKKELKIFPLDNLGGNITSLAINPIKNDSILVTTLSGSLIEISLP